jgi:molybdate transport system substrate-binding protein
MALAFRVILFFLWVSFTLHAGQIRVALAANASYVMEDLKKAFYRLYPDITLDIILGSSGKLTAQIMHGAPYDIFLSANRKYPDTLYETKSAVTKPVVYAKGALALLSVNTQDFSQGIAVLENPKIDKIAIANPKTAPYVVAAKEALENAKLYEKVKTKLVYAESISQTLAYTATAADIGIVAKSSLFSPRMRSYKKEKHWVDVNASLYAPIDQGMVILKSGEENAEVKAFYDFMLSPKAKAILKRYGYRVK